MDRQIAKGASALKRYSRNLSRRFENLAVRREFPSPWRTITRLGLPLSIIGAAPYRLVDGAVPAELLFGWACMTRDDLLFWLSLVWLVSLCGAAIWVLLVA